MAQWSGRVRGVFWIFVGVIVVLIGAYILDAVFSHSGGRGLIVGKTLDKAVRDSLVLQDISIALPDTIGRTQFRYIALHGKNLIRPEAQSSYSGENAPMRGYERMPDSWGIVNYIFTRADGTEAHLLLHTRALITQSEIPSHTDSILDFILYRIVTEDSNGDGQLTQADRSDLYVSDLSGNNLQQITTASILPGDIATDVHARTVTFVAKVCPPDSKVPPNDWQEQLFVYNIKNNHLSTFFPNDSLFSQARALVHGK